MLESPTAAMVGKSERGPETVASIAKHRWPTYAVAAGIFGVESMRGSAWWPLPELAWRRCTNSTVKDMPVTVAVSADGESVHETGRKKWAGKFAGIRCGGVASERLAHQQRDPKRVSKGREFESDKIKPPGGRL